MERKKHCERPKENIIRHMANLSILHGVFYKGVYYDNGVGRPHKLAKSGCIYKRDLTKK